MKLTDSLSPLVLTNLNGLLEAEMEPDPLYRHIGNQIRSLRIDRRLTQEALAKKVSLSRSSVANIESGRQKLLVHQMLEISEALEVSLEALIPQPRKLEITNTKMRNLLAHATDLVKDQPEGLQDWIVKTLADSDDREDNR